MCYREKQISSIRMLLEMYIYAIDPLQLLTRSKHLHAMKEFGRY